MFPNDEKQNISVSMKILVALTSAPFEINNSPTLANLFFNAIWRGVWLFLSKYLSWICFQMIKNDFS